ncbi:MAG: hypothetical protein II954_03200 [Synergistaceae bacterium]|nr:hypothetical protein [Synergistaceae bacterium]
MLGNNVAKVDVDALLRKLPATASSVDINAALDGEWQTQVSASEDGKTVNFADGGGYRFHDGNLMPISATFMNMTFSSTDIEAGTTTLSGIAVEEVVDVSSGTPKYNTVYSVLNAKTAKVSHLFGNVYLISDVSPYPVIDVSLLAMFDGGKLSIISEAYTTYNGVVEENRAIFITSKTTESNITNLSEFIGSSWKSSLNVLDVYADDENFTLLDVDLASFDVSFPSADIENKKLTLSLNARVTTPEQTIPVENLSVVLNVKRAGYNVLFGEAESGDLFTVTLITDRLAIITGDIGYTRKDWYDVDFLAVVQKVDAE